MGIKKRNYSAGIQCMEMTSVSDVNRKYKTVNRVSEIQEVQLKLVSFYHYSKI